MSVVLPTQNAHDYRASTTPLHRYRIKKLPRQENYNLFVYTWFGKEAWRKSSMDPISFSLPTMNAPDRQQETRVANLYGLPGFEGRVRWPGRPCKQRSLFAPSPALVWTMTSEQTSQPESRDSGEEQEDDFGYSRFPERTLGQGKKPALKGKIISSLFGSQYRCQSMLKIALDSKSPPRLPSRENVFF